LKGGDVIESNFSVENYKETINKFKTKVEKGLEANTHFEN
jgi:hypothetical protein